MFYRRTKYLETVLSLLDEDNDVTKEKSKHQIFDYVPTNCHEDKLMFQDWENQQDHWNSTFHDLHGVFINQPKECVEYSLYVANQPVLIDDMRLPSSILEKIKNRRILETVQYNEVQP